MEEIIKFTKMHGIGNDYIYIDCLDGSPTDIESLARSMSDRHTGVGADGIILIMPSTIADFKMRMFNADGSEGRMCGNASRCIAKYVHDRGLTDKTTITLDTLSGVKILKLNLHNEQVESVTVDMGEPILDAVNVPVISACGEPRVIEQPVDVGGATVKVTAVSMGNPHCVIFGADPDGVDVHRLGAAIEVHDMWPDRVNVEFVQVIDRNTLKMRVWERGSGETLACGTGACAALVAAVLTGRCDREADVRLAGGSLHIEWREADNHVYMTGGATTVYEGKYFRS